jgi:Rieske Fe-S protein
VLAGGAAACGLVGLSACTVSDGLSDSPAGAGRASVEPGGVLTDGLETGSALPFENVDGEPAVLVRLDDGAYAAWSAVCTHQGCTVSYRDAALRCPCHGSVFDPADGSVLEGPADEPLPSVDVQEGPGGVSLA